MNKVVTIVIDAMGGDNAPAAPVEGAVLALSSYTDLCIVLVGTKEALDAELAKHSYDQSRLTCVYSTEVIITGENPVASIQHKKDSSLVVGLNLLRNGEADAFISSGNTGSVLVGGQVIIRKAPGVKRAPLAPLIPTSKGASLLIDCGANVDARPEHLLQFAVMGSLYVEKMLGIRTPRVALLNIGAEREKGNALVKETYPLLEKESRLNFIGNIEANEIPEGKADVIVTEAFCGNLVLKMYEGVSKTMMKILKEAMFSSLKTKIGAVLIKSALKEKLKAYDVDSYGGAPLLGLRRLLVKTHGNAKAAVFCQAIGQCITYVHNRMTETFNEALQESGKS